MAENSRNVHKHGMGGIVLASVLLICIALTSLIITFSVLAKSKEPPKEPDTEQSDGNTDNSQNGDESNGNGNGDDGSGNGNENEDNAPTSVVVDKSNTEIYKGPLLQLDSANPYRRPEEELLKNNEMAKLTAGQLMTRYNFVQISSRADGNFIPANNNRFLDIDATEAFCAMMAQYVAETGNRDIWLRNAYYYDPTYEDDKSTLDINEALLNPHAVGMAVDLQIKIVTTNADGKEVVKQIPLLNSYSGYGRAEYYDWFVSNCHKYGYIHTGNETQYSTFRYIGVPHATYIYNSGLPFESYLALIRTKTAEDRLVTTDADGKEWWIYYVEASEDAVTSVRVFGSKYSIYGDNVGGFIVTVDTTGL